VSQHCIFIIIVTSNIKLIFFNRIDSKNGNVYLIESPDRESTPTLTVMVRVEVTGRKGKSTYTVHPVAHDIGTRFQHIVIIALVIKLQNIMAF